MGWKMKGGRLGEGPGKVKPAGAAHRQLAPGTYRRWVQVGADNHPLNTGHFLPGKNALVPIREPPHYI
jgi:hypothetical protein